MKLLAAAALIVAATSSNAFSQCPETEKKKLEQLDRAWSDAGQSGDRAHLQGVFADDFAGLSPAGQTTKTQEIDTAVRLADRVRASGKPAPKVVHDYYMIGCTPRTATITHRNVITDMVDGKPRTLHTRSVHMLENRGERWQVVSNAGQPLGDDAVLLYMEREWSDADLKGDSSWHERNYAEDFSGISSRTGALSTKSEEIASGKKLTLSVSELSDLDVRVHGDTGVVTGILRVVGKDDKSAAFDRNVRFTDTFVKRDGRWVVWASQGTEIK
jgi:ketosteroid isomerase-like protein